jgi:hypothetical protein
MDKPRQNTAKGEASMKDIKFDAQIAAARPENYNAGNEAFTDKVMAQVASNEIFSQVIRKTSVTKKETLLMKIRHLPKIAIIAAILGALLFLAGTTYAIVQTVSKPSPVTVKESGVNEFGREQLSIEFDSCDTQKKNGTTYELKRGGNLSAEDGAKVLRATCDIDRIKAWIENDPRSKELLGTWNARSLWLPNDATTVTRIENNTLTLKNGERERSEQVHADARVFEGDTPISLSAIQPGDTIFYFAPARYPRNAPNQEAGHAIFKLPLEARYYGIDFRSYVHARAACDGNPERTCLKSNSINQTNLMVTYGGTQTYLGDPRASRAIQGRIVSYDATSIKLDVGHGVIYTVQTPHNVVEHYNQQTVYGLAAFDGIYAKTNPEDLKIKVGDSLDIGYLEAANEFSKELSWNKVTGVNLMVERTVKDLDVLQKY